jgi:hypothetical protein
MTNEHDVKMLDPKARRKDSSFLVMLPSGSAVRCKRVDIQIAILEGVVPMPLLSSMSAMVGQRKELAQDPMRVLSMPDRERKAMLEVLRRYAVHAVVEPQLSLLPEDQAPDGTMSVDLLHMNELVAIWAAVPVPTSMSESEAETFRRTESAADGAAAPDGGEVRDAPVDVAEIVGERQVLTLHA